MKPPANPNEAQLTPVMAALKDDRATFIKVAWFSLITGLMVLVPTWFMLEVYDRVVNSRNERTLWMLFLIVIVAYVVMEMLDVVRSRMLHGVGERLDAKLRNRLFDATFAVTLMRRGTSTQAFADLRTLREFVPSPAVTAIFDSPAAILFLIFVYSISPWLGAIALVGAIAQVAIAVSTEKKTMPLLTEANKHQIEASSYANSSLRNAQVIESMGMIGDIYRRWSDRQNKTLVSQAKASDTAGLNTVATKQIQLMLGSLILGASCWIELQGLLPGSSGMMIVASILGGRVLTPLAQLVAQWRLVVNARDARGRLDKLLEAVPEQEPAMPLPAPKGLLTVEAVVAGAPGSPVPILKGVSFGVKPGSVMAIVGPSASGKTTLARLLIGLWPAQSGKVRLDSVDVFTWDKAELGPHVGYMPQGVELFEGTIAENVARFGVIDDAKVQRALEMVGMADWVATLPDGANTKIGDEGATLSGGQRQRVGMARAVYGDPKFIVLDEPNASLDEQGEQALITMLGKLRAMGSTVVVISHRTSILPACDQMLVLREGQVALAGPRDEVLAKLKQAAEQAMQQAPGGTPPQPGGAAPAGGLQTMRPAMAPAPATAAAPATPAAPAPQSAPQPAAAPTSSFSFGAAKPRTAPGGAA